MFARYTIDQPIGEGGAGRVYSAADQSGTQYAVKRLDPKKVTSDKLKRFKNEVQFGLRNVHQNIIRIVDYGLHIDGTTEVPFYVMPLYPSTLRHLLRSLYRTESA